MSAPERAGKPPNGVDVAAAVQRAAAAPLPTVGAPALLTPSSAVQRSRFPFLQHFAARGLLDKAGKRMTAYEVRLGFQLGLAAGRELLLTFTPGTPARGLSKLLRQVADTLDALADDCDREGVDPRDQPKPATAPDDTRSP